jgi:hypothetical protein
LIKDDGDRGVKQTVSLRSFATRIYVQPAERFALGSMNSDLITTRIRQVAIVWTMLAAGATYLFLFEPGKTGFFPGCPFRALTGLDCPGCGSTRAVHQLLHGQLAAAFEFNPLLILSLPFFLYALWRYTGATLRGQPVTWPQPDAKYIWTIVAAIGCFWIFRNTPFYPFHP